MYAQDSKLMERLANLGPKSLEMLARAGVTSEHQLRNLGSVATYSLVKRCNPKASLNLLWALEGALTGLSWREVSKVHRTSLLFALEQHDAASAAATLKRPDPRSAR